MLPLLCSFDDHTNKLKSSQRLVKTLQDLVESQKCSVRECIYVMPPYLATNAHK